MGYPDSGLTDDSYTRLDQGENDQLARLRFTGHFEGRDVIWCCRFCTLRQMLSEVASNVNRMQNFIEIAEVEGDEIPILIGLGVPTINHQTIKKMILMVRQYKRLRKGRHEFGSFLYRNAIEK